MTEVPPPPAFGSESPGAPPVSAAENTGERTEARTAIQRRRQHRRSRRRLLGVGAVLAVIVVALVVWYAVGNGPGSSGPPEVSVSVGPGLTLQEVAERVDALPDHGGESFAHVAASGVVHSMFSPAGSDDLEGMLGTGNYRIQPGESDTAILTTMVHRFDAQAKAAGLSTSSAAAFGLSPYQVIIAASIVEKEGYIPKNMPDVARVIYNRLAAGTPLQMNATVLYSLGQDGGAVTSQDLKLQTPYNTYLNVGLTPTPICSPSTDALTAAVHPPAGAWLFFVLVNKDGTEAFADTYAEQLANEKLAQQRGVG